MVNHCYYINLERRTDRKEFIESQLNKSRHLSSIYKRFDAVDGSTVNPREIEPGILTENAIRDILMDTISAWGLSMTQGGLGVLMSYINLFKIISELDGPVITFEDDVELSDNFDDYLERVISELPSDFDYCYLGYGDHKINTKEYSEHISIPVGMITCLPGLIISPKGAKRLLHVLQNVDNQIDTALYFRQNLLNVFVSNEKIVNVRNQFTTDIQGNNSCKKNYKKQNYILTTLAYGVNANTNALKLAIDLDYFKQRLLVVTDNPSLYVHLKNVITVPYPQKRFSYNDKIICFEEGFKYDDCVVYIDSDCRIFYRSFKETFANLLQNIEPGFHPSWDWGIVSRPTGGFFNSTDVSGRVSGYGELALSISKDLDININQSYHYQEGIIIVSKEDGKEVDFLDTWKTFSSQLDDFEIKNGAKRIGIGEGNIIGLSVVKSGLTVRSNRVSNILGEDIKYNFYAPFIDDYIKNHPDRKTVKVSDGKLIKSNSTIITFKDKEIDLSYSIFETLDNMMVLTFNWNNNNSVEFLDHEFKINDVVYHFNSDKSNELYFQKHETIEVYHTYDWYGERDWILIDTL
jgi:GR25 family glycosyltransferase involved in LPS biosynthesis